MCVYNISSLSFLLCLLTFVRVCFKPGNEAVTRFPVYLATEYEQSMAKYCDLEGERRLARAVFN